jgi:moderate conductance mechanosensitive channel
MRFVKLTICYLIGIVWLGLVAGNVQAADVGAAQNTPAETAQPAAAPAQPTASPQKAAATLLTHLSQSISSFHVGVVQWMAEYQEIKKTIAATWVQLKSAHERDEWLMLLGKCVVILGLSYAAFSISQRLIVKMLPWFPVQSQRNFFSKIINLFIQWFLNILPIAIFAAVAYTALIFLPTPQKIQWILLIWISALLMVWLFVTVLDFFISVCTAFPGFFTIPETTLHFLKKWLTALARLIIYGYFILQALPVLGLSTDTVNVLMNLLGLLIVITLILCVVCAPQWSSKLRINLISRLMMVVYLLLLYVAWIMQAQHFFWFVLKSTALSVVLLLIVAKILRSVRKHLRGEFHITPLLKKRLPGLEQRCRRYRRILDAGLRMLIGIITAILILRIWQAPDFNLLPAKLREALIVKVVTLFTLILVVTLIWEISNSFIEMWLTKNTKDATLETGRTHTLLTVSRRSLLIVLGLITVLMVLSEIGISIGPLLAGAGVLGLAISFGAQKLMQDLITGFFMLLENQVAVGDYVRVGEMAGTVEAVAIRTLRLRDTAGVVHIIPYSSIVNVSNFTKDFSYYLMEVNVAYRENVDEVIAVLRKIAEGLRKDPQYSPWILEPLDVMGLDKFADSAVVIKVRIKTKPGWQWVVGREFNRRMKQKFDELDIQIPFPHTMVFFGDDRSLPPTPAVPVQTDQH